MASFDPAQFMAALDLLTLSVALLSGLVAGWLLLWQQPLATLWLVLVAGEAFDFALAMSRWVESYANWPRNVAVCVLFALFCVGLWLGRWIRRVF